MAIGPVQNDVLPSSMSVIKSLIAGIYVCIMCINKIKGIIQVLPKCIGHMSMYVMLHCKLHRISPCESIFRAHILAFENPNAKGRYIVASEGLWFVDIARILQNGFPQIKFPVFELPNVITLIGGLFDPRITVRHMWAAIGVFVIGVKCDRY